MKIRVVLKYGFAALVAGVLVLQVASAGAAPSGPLTRVSKTTILDSIGYNAEVQPAIATAPGSKTLVSAFEVNRAYNGGGINFGNTLTVASSTISGNVAGGPGLNGDGGGIEGSSGANLMVASSTITGNQSWNGSSSGGGIDAPTATLQNTIVANNLSHATDQSATFVDNCSVATTTSQGNNLSDGSDCSLTQGTDHQGVPVLLGPLADNGGPTDTEAVLPGSAALDAGAGCPATDERGASRPRGTACEIGAYEVAAPLVTTTAAKSVGLNSALLTGTIDPSLQGTSFRFEYGPTTAYGSSTPVQWVLPGSAVTVSALVAGLRQGVAYHFRLVASNVDGAATGGDLSFTTLDRTKPVLSLLKVAPGIFRAIKGTTISFKLSEVSTVTFKADRVLPGVRRGKSCVARTKRVRGRACTRYLPVKGSASKPGVAGVNKLHFDARFGGRRLAPGAYRLDAIPRDTSGNLGKTVIAAFRIRR